MKRDIDDILKQALSPDITPDARLNQRIIHQGKENLIMKRKPNFRVQTAVLTACCVLAVGSATTYAAWKLLGAGDVAREYGDLTLAETFTGEDAILVNETQTYGNFRVTLLGAVGGEAISDYLGQNAAKGNATFYAPSVQYPQLENEHLYTVVAIERADGTPMPDVSADTYGDETFLVSPYIKGLLPHEYNALTMGGSYTEIVIDGVQYRILETDNVELFADRGVYIGVSDGTFYNNDAYTYDEATGEMSRNESYSGLNALFTLPLDPSHADPEAAEAYLQLLAERGQTSGYPVTYHVEAEDFSFSTATVTLPDTLENLARAGQTSGTLHYDEASGQYIFETTAAAETTSDSAPEEDDTQDAFREWVDSMKSGSNTVDQEALLANCAVLPQTVQTCAVTDGKFSYSFDLDGQGGGQGNIKINYAFSEESSAGTMVFLDTNYSLIEGNSDFLSTAKLTTVTLNGDGTVTVAVDVPKEALARYTAEE